MSVLKLLPWFLLSLVVTSGGSWWLGHHTGYGTADAKGQAEISKLKAKISAERERASEDARKAERQYTKDLAAAAATYQEGLKNAKAHSDRLVADLRAGNVKLQDRWHACVATSVVPSPAGSAGGIDEGPGLRAAGQGTVLEDIAASIRDGAEADAAIRALQAVVKADREATQPKTE